VCTTRGKAEYWLCFPLAHANAGSVTLGIEVLSSTLIVNNKQLRVAGSESPPPPHNARNAHTRAHSAQPHIAAREHVPQCNPLQGHTAQISRSVHNAIFIGHLSRIGICLGVLSNGHLCDDLLAAHFWLAAQAILPLVSSFKTSSPKEQTQQMRSSLFKYFNSASGEARSYCFIPFSKLNCDRPPHSPSQLWY